MPSSTGPSPTALSLALLRKHGYAADVVERFHSHGGKSWRKDFCGFADIIAFRAQEGGCLAVQATSRSNQSTRLRKAKAIPALYEWLTSSNRFEVWGWKLELNEKDQLRWRPTRTPVTISDLEPPPIVDKKGQHRLRFD